MLWYTRTIYPETGETSAFAYESELERDAGVERAQQRTRLTDNLAGPYRGFSITGAIEPEWMTASERLSANRFYEFIRSM